MYSRNTRKRKSTILDLDSLMDVLTCSVGVMLFIVIFAVLEVRGSSILIFTPLERDPPEGSTRIFVLCQKVGERTVAGSAKQTGV